MNYKDFLLLICSSIKDGYIDQNLAKKSKEFTLETIRMSRNMKQDISYGLKKMYNTNLQSYHLSICTLSEGNCQLQEIVLENIFDCLESILIVLQNEEYIQSEKLHYTAIKALYSVLQHILNKTKLDEAVKEKLNEINLILENIILSTSIPEAGLISASCFVLIISHTKQFPVKYFKNLLCHKYETNLEDRFKFEDHNLSKNGHLFDSKEKPIECMEKCCCLLNTTCSNLTLIYGVLNVKPFWLFQDEVNDCKIDLIKNFKSMRCLFFNLWPHIEKYCKEISSNSSHQPIQVLCRWIHVLGLFIKENPLESLEDHTHKNVIDNLKLISNETCYLQNIFVKESSQDGATLNDKIKSKLDRVLQNTEKDLTSQKTCFLCKNENFGRLFSLEINNFGEIPKILYLNFESHSKGVPSLALQCFKDFINIHEYFLKGHVILTSQLILECITYSVSFSHKGAYLILQLAFEILKVQEVIDHYPCIPYKLFQGLRTNQFAVLATNVFRIIVSKTIAEQWLEYFREVHLLSIKTDDQSLWANYKTLWLPIIISHHPKLINKLMKLSNDSLHEWESKLAILRISRSKDLVNVFSEASEVPDIKDFIISCCCNRADPENFVGKSNYALEKDCQSTNVERYEENNDFKSVYMNGLVHENENIRSEVFAFLCITKKSSLPLNKIEVTLLKHFLEQNMSLDSQSFRQSIIKSFNVLVCRLRDSCLKEFKKIKSELNDKIVKKIFDSEFGISLDFLIWLINFLNINLNPLGNYPRLCTTLNLYSVLLSNFYECNNSKIIEFNNSKSYSESVVNNPTGKKNRNDLPVFKCKDTLTKTTNASKYDLLREFIQNISKYKSTKYKIISHSLMCQNTVSLFMTCCTNEMNNIREVAGNILLFLKKNDGLNIENELNMNREVVEKYCTFKGISVNKGNQSSVNENCSNKYFQEWFDLGLKMLKSPKASEMESGANVIQILLDISDEEMLIIPVFKSSNDESEISKPTSQFEKIISYFIWSIQKQFESAQLNILKSSYSGPISGTVIALTNCLIECHIANRELSSNFILHVVSRLGSLYQNLIKFILNTMASCSVDGPNVPPSFADMGKSIDLMIANCRQSRQSVRCEESLTEVSCDEKRCNGVRTISEREPSGEENEYKGRLSNEQQLVLSFCWHLLKTCCHSSSKIFQKYFLILNNELCESLLEGTVVLVLTSTRHKGAMESAQEALGLMTRCVFDHCDLKGNEEKVQIVERQLIRVLELIESSVNAPRISTTRRAAGLSMLFTAICSSIPRSHSLITDQVIRRLICLAKIKVDATNDSGSVDLSSTLSLHILHSMVLSSKITSSVEPLLTSISILCFESFASELWSVRNASLQLFGAIVPRLLGQKRVKQDTAVLNSITASEFCNRNPSLTKLILEILSWCSENEVDAIIFHQLGNVFSMNYINDKHSFLHLKENIGFSGYNACSSIELSRESVSSEESSFLVPLLNLLSRLNPGSKIQWSEEVEVTLNTFIILVFPLLGNASFTIRRLAATSLVALSDLKNREKLLTFSLSNDNDWHYSSNFINGILLFIESIIDTDSWYLNQCDHMKALVTKWLKHFLNTECYFNRNLIIRILPKVDSFNIGRDDSILNIITSYSNPGLSLYVRAIVAKNLESDLISYIDCIFSDNQDIWEEACIFLKKSLRAEVDMNKLNIVQNSLWQYLKQLSIPVLGDDYFKLSKILDLLGNILNFSPLNIELCALCTKSLQYLLKNFSFHTKLILVVCSHYILHNLKVDTTSKVFSELLKDWALATYDATHPKMSEDNRSCASKALQITFGTVMNKTTCDKEILFILLKGSINLLQDENLHIRISASLIVASLNSKNIIGINPYFSLNLLIYHLWRFAIDFQEFDYIELLWKISFNYSLEILESSEKSTFTLFESSTDNIYREPHGVSSLALSHLDIIFKNKNPDMDRRITSNFKIRAREFIYRKIIIMMTLFERYKSLSFVDSLVYWKNVLIKTTCTDGRHFLFILARIFNIEHSDEQFGNNFSY